MVRNIPSHNRHSRMGEEILGGEEREVVNVRYRFGEGPERLVSSKGGNSLIGSSLSLAALDLETVASCNPMITHIHASIHDPLRTPLDNLMASASMDREKVDGIDSPAPGHSRNGPGGSQHGVINGCSTSVSATVLANYFSSVTLRKRAAFTLLHKVEGYIGTSDCRSRAPEVWVEQHDLQSLHITQ